MTEFDTREFTIITFGRTFWLNEKANFVQHQSQEWGNPLKVGLCIRLGLEDDFITLDVHKTLISQECMKNLSGA